MKLDLSDLGIKIVGSGKGRMVDGMLVLDLDTSELEAKLERLRVCMEALDEALEGCPARVRDRLRRGCAELLDPERRGDGAAE